MQARRGELKTFPRVSRCSVQCACWSQSFPFRKKSAGEELSQDGFWEHFPLYPKVVMDGRESPEPLPSPALAPGFALTDWSLAK